MSAKTVRPFHLTSFLRGVGKGLSVRKFKKDEIIFLQGDDADSLFYIQEGGVKLTVVSEQGKEAVIALMEAGEFFGESCINGQLVRVATATSLGECTITAIPKSILISAIKNEPSFAEFVIKRLVSRTRRLEDDLVDQLFNPSERRLARLLLILAHFGEKENSTQPIDIKLDQQTLAEMVGTTRSRVSYFMNKLRRLGFITYNGSIHVSRSLLNSVLRDNPALRIPPLDNSQYT